MLGYGGYYDNTHHYSYLGERLDALKEDFLLHVVGVGGARKTPGSGRSDVFALYSSRCSENNNRMMDFILCIMCVYVYARAYKNEV